MLRLVKACGAVLLSLGVMTKVEAATPIRVEVRGIQYDVTTTYFTGYVHQNNAVWWGNRDLAIEFASAVGDQLGYPNLDEYASFDPRLNRGPFFAHAGPYVISTTDNAFLAVHFSNFSFEDDRRFVVRDILPISFNGYHYAIATPVPAVPEPGTALLVALGLAGLASVACRRGTPRSGVGPTQRSDSLEERGLKAPFFSA